MDRVRGSAQVVREVVSPSVETERESPPGNPQQVIEKKVETSRVEAEKASKPQPEITRKISDIEKGIVRSVFDSTFRGIIRYFESFFDNQFLRVLYRLGSETARKTSEIAFLNVLDKKKIFSLNDFKNGSMRALEHIPATAIVEPSLFEGSIPRVLAGLGNMTLRFASRFGFYKINSTSREVLGEKNLLDEFTSRSLARVIPVNFESPGAGIGMRILEQLVIDLNLHVFKPLSRLFPQFADFVSKNQDSKKVA